MHTFPNGLKQPQGSMRFALDALLLPCFVRETLARHPAMPKNPLRDQAFGLESRGLFAAADLGCGCGASSLGLCLLLEKAKVLGVDRERQLVDCALENGALLGLSKRSTFFCHDLVERMPYTRPLCDIVLMNPPYWEAGSGLVSDKALNEGARRGHDSLELFFRAARELLVHHGRLFVIYPAQRLSHLVSCLKSGGFGLRTLKVMRPFANLEATRVLCEAKKDAKADCVILPDLVLYERDAQGTQKATDSAHAFCPWLR